MTASIHRFPVRLALLAVAAATALSACSPPVAKTVASPATPAVAPAKPATPQVPAGDYTLDKSHSTIVFKLTHLGFSYYTAQFAAWDAKLKFDPAHPGAASLEATIDPRSLTLPSPPAGFHDQLTGSAWLDVVKYPAITFRSTQVVVTGPNTAKITGDLTLHGVTKPVVLEASFNGGYAGFEMDPHARVGFSAHGVFKRSDFGMGFGVPAPGSTMGVGDEVDVRIETEFSGPAWVKSAAS